MNIGGEHKMDKKIIKYSLYSFLMLCLVFMVFYWIVCCLAWTSRENYLNYAPMNYVYARLVLTILILIGTCITIWFMEKAKVENNIKKSRLLSLLNMIFIGVILIFNIIITYQFMYCIPYDSGMKTAMESLFFNILYLYPCLNIFVLFILGMFFVQNIKMFNITPEQKEQKIKEEKHSKQQKIDAKISKLQQEKEELEDKSEKAS